MYEIEESDVGKEMEGIGKKEGKKEHFDREAVNRTKRWCFHKNNALY